MAATGELLAALSRPEAFPTPTPEVEVRQTHISMVFLGGEVAYKLKKPVNLGFLDYSTPELRRHFCEEEVRLNRRLAPSVYLGVVPVTRAPDGSLGFEGPGEVVEAAVKMRRLPDEATFKARLEAGTLVPEDLARLARHLAGFYAGSAPAPEGHGDFDEVAANCRENFAQLVGYQGDIVSPAVFRRLRERTEALLQELEPLLRARAARGVPRDTHGDLRLEHVYVEGGELLVVDCIEFNERFRYADPVADVAFLAMELEHYGRPDLGRAFTEAYLEAGDDAEGRQLLDFYLAYRHVVRAKVRSFESGAAEIPEQQRRRDRESATAHFHRALFHLAAPAVRPCLVLCAGLPGSGKSTLARRLAAAGFVRVSTDHVRKSLAGLPTNRHPTPEQKGRIYNEDYNQRTYAEVERRVREALLQGERVVMDATFTRCSRRREGLELGRCLGVPVLYLLAQVPEAVLAERIADRTDAESDADWKVYCLLRDAWEPEDARTLAARVVLDNSGAPEATWAQVEDALGAAGLL